MCCAGYAHAAHCMGMTAQGRILRDGASLAGGPVTRKHWAALLRQLDRSDPSYRR
jgi:hypothetical protein